jgi:hypothetical protein
MGTNELFTGPGTSDRMQKLAESLPPYDLLKAYREAAQHFHTTDIVLVVVPDQKQLEGFNAMPRPAYVERAFQRWTEQQRALHPVARESAHRHLKLPVERPAFWLIVESPNDGAVGHVAIGAIFRPALDQASAS